MQKWDAPYLISTITNRGKLCFKVFTQRFDTAVMLDFLHRLVRHSAQKVFLIVDGHPVHRSKAVQRPFERHADRIRLFFLPSYSPELNPDELLNHDVKEDRCRAAASQKKPAMIDNIRSYLRSTQRQPRVVQNLCSRETCDLRSRLNCSVFNALVSKRHLQ